jgi:hypothetical protein
MDCLLRETLVIKFRVLGGDRIRFCEETFVPFLAHFFEVPSLKVINYAEYVSHIVFFRAFKESHFFVAL